MKKIKLFKLLALFMVLMASINTAWAGETKYNWSKDATVFFDNSSTQWTQPYLRLGCGSDDGNWSSNYTLTKVAGTKDFWYFTMPAQFNGYAAFQLVNNSGDGYNIYWAGSDHAWTKSTEYQKYAVSSNITICATDVGTTYCSTTKTNGRKSFTVSYSTSGTGTGTLTVTKYNGSTYDAFSSGSSVDPTQIMMIVATPDDGNALSSFSVSGATRIGETDTYYVTANTTISATFTPEETHTVRILYKDYESGDEIADYRDVANVGVTTTTSISPKDIDGYEFKSWACGTHVKNNDSSTDTDIDINSKTCSSDCDFTITAYYTRLTRLAFSNPQNWSNVYAYVWDGSATPDASGKNADWPGVKISKTIEINCVDRLYYEFNAETHSTWTSIIFNNGSSGDGNQTTNLTISGNDGKYYNGSSWKGTLTDYTVSVATEASYKGTVSGGGTAREEGCTASITATPKPGYRFDSWTSDDDVTFGNASSATTTVLASENATVTATFNQNKIIYFDNTMSKWDDSNGIWVYLFSNTYGVWYDDAVNGGVHPGVNRLEYGRMTRIGTSNIYYYEYSTGSTIAGVAFAKADQHNNTAFYQTSAAWITSFPTCLPCYMASESYMSKNSTGYHSYGYWKKWGDTNSGFTLWLNNSGWTSYNFTTEDPSSSVYTTTVTMSSANTTYGYNVARCSGGKKLRRADYRGDIQDSDSDYPRELGESDYDGGLRTSSAGEYKFTLSLATDHIMLTVEYPLSVGDYRVRLADGTRNHPSGRVIRARSVSKTDTISFFIDHTKTNVLYVDTCTYTGTPIRWNNISDVDAATLTLSSTPYTTKTGVYKFGITRTKNKNVALSLLDEPEYDGKYYIRTDVSDGKWTSYMSAADNIMHYSEYSLSTSAEYDYYYTKWAAKDKNMHFVVANDYSPCISDTLTSDATYLYKDDQLPADANVRFSWNSHTNATSRAFISGSSNIRDRFLVLEGDTKMFDKDGNPLTSPNQYYRVNDDMTITRLYEENHVVFDDDHNWIYETTVQAQPGAQVKLTAKYNENVQYFYGDDGTDHEDSVLLIGGSGTDKYKMRVVYDFKTNRLIKAFVPEGTINDKLAIETDMMIVREHQGVAQQITFGASGTLSKVKTVYGAMKFNKWTVNNKAKTGEHDELTGGSALSQYERDLFWISFPFDVNLSDAFGFGTYGTHWIIEYYDGKGRAMNGYWVDSEPNWKFVTPSMRDTFKLKAFEGYILALDLDQLGESSPVWENDVDSAYIYFPSALNVDSITKKDTTIRIDQTGYECTINRQQPNEAYNVNKNRTIADSYWHCIGVPSFANKAHDINDDWTISEGDPSEVDAGDYPSIQSWGTGDLLFVYRWNSSDNSLVPENATSFTFNAMHSYMVQYNGNTITWSTVTTPVKSIAARQMDIPDLNFCLQLLKDSVRQDQTFVRFTDKAGVTSGFEFNYDMSKEYNGNRGNIWTLTTNGVQVAGNSMPHPLATTIVPVGVKIATTGDYTFSIPEGTNGGDVWLLDNQTNSRTNLGLMDYTVNLTAGTIDGRFSLEFPVQNVVTDMETVDNGQLTVDNDVRKVFVGGRLYIIRDGKAYDATGAQVK